ncbi:MAG: nucleotidyltransferase domain-containing protein [Candidatus Paceibacterota bacterium]|jgi:predicted nucleotidyltransferase
MRKLNDLLNSYLNFNMWQQSIVLAYRGSIAHGTYVPNSNSTSIDDKDILGIAMPTRQYFFGLKSFEQFEKFEGEWDVLIYDFRKAVRLLMKSNPNILQILWTPDKYILKQTDIYQKLRENRHLFVHKGIYKTFCGYSFGQLHKMENMAYNGYMGQKRKGLVDKFGYDTKNAQHLIRLLRQGIEFLQTGELIVERPDAGELKQIKAGEWTVDKVKREADKLFKQMEDAFRKSTLPDGCEAEKIHRLVMELNYDYYTTKQATESA